MNEDRLHISIQAILVILFVYSTIQFNMDTDNFYIHLPSNVIPTSPLQIGNSIGNYVTRLNRRMYLSDEWEVALTDISYTKSWYNIMKDQRLKLVQFSQREIDIDEILPAGNYESVEELIASINKIFYDFAKRHSDQVLYSPELHYNKQSNKIRIRLGAQPSGSYPYLFPNFSPFLANFLGLTDSQGRQFPNVPHYNPIIKYEFVESGDSDTTDSEDEETVAKPKQPEPVKVAIPVAAPQPPVIILNPVITGDISGLADPKVNQPIITPSQTSSPTQTLNIPPAGPTAPQQTASKTADVPIANLPISVKLSKTQAPTTTTTTTSTNISTASGFTVTKQHIDHDSGHGKLQRTASDLAASQHGNILMWRTPQPHMGDQPQPSNISKKVYVEGFKEVSLYGTIHSLYVYCSVIKPVLVGNVEAPLIRRVEIPSVKKFGEDCEINYSQPQYYPLVYHEFDNIEIDIKDDTDNTIEFAFGRTAVTLHFRKKRRNVSD